MKCQCNTKGILDIGTEQLYDKEKELPFVNHEPYKCKCTNDIKKYKRDNKVIWLCSCCHLFSDIEVQSEEQK